MRERTALDVFAVNAAEYLTTGDRRVGEGTVVVVSSVTGSTVEMVDGVKKAQAAGAKVLGFRRGDHRAGPDGGLGDCLSGQ